MYLLLFRIFFKYLHKIWSSSGIKQLLYLVSTLYTSTLEKGNYSVMGLEGFYQGDMSWLVISNWHLTLSWNNLELEYFRVKRELNRVLNQLCYILYYLFLFNLQVSISHLFNSSLCHILVTHNRFSFWLVIKYYEFCLYFKLHFGPF